MTLGPRSQWPDKRVKSIGATRRALAGTQSISGGCMDDQAHKVVIVGGGAGGLELASKLGRRFGPEHVFLVDSSSDHIWKPSLHEVAAGTLDIHREGLSYAMMAKDSGF